MIFMLIFDDVSWLCLMMLDDDDTVQRNRRSVKKHLPHVPAFPNQKTHLPWIVSLKFHPASKVANVEVFKPSSIDILL